jgi:hypothetical protein
MINKNYEYKEPIEIKERRESIWKNQLPIENLYRLIDEGASEEKFHKVFKQDMSFLGDAFQIPKEEYICLSNVLVGNDYMDFMVLTSRSRMVVYLIKVKGADFYITNDSTDNEMNIQVLNSIEQIHDCITYISDNYDDFRKYIHNIRRQAVEDRYKFSHLVGPRGDLLIDINKDIKISAIFIGGKTKDEYDGSRKINCYEENLSMKMQIFTWESFLRRVDKEHGSHYNYILDKEELFQDIFKACAKLQSNTTFCNVSEDKRNDFIRDILDTAGYDVRDQTRQGYSGSGKDSGEVDILVRHNKLSISVIEALNLDCLNTAYLKEHIDKIYKYDTVGNNFNFLVSYVKVKKFGEFWKNYCKHIIECDYPFKLISIEESNKIYDYSDIKYLITKHERNGNETFLYHICLKIIE